MTLLVGGEEKEVVPLVEFATNEELHQLFREKGLQMKSQQEIDEMNRMKAEEQMAENERLAQKREERKRKLDERRRMNPEESRQQERGRRWREREERDPQRKPLDSSAQAEL
jgi:hypothetical protein